MQLLYTIAPGSLYCSHSYPCLTDTSICQSSKHLLLLRLLNCWALHKLWPSVALQVRHWCPCSAATSPWQINSQELHHQQQASWGILPRICPTINREYISPRLLTIGPTQCTGRVPCNFQIWDALTPPLLVLVLVGKALLFWHTTPTTCLTQISWTVFWIGIR